jgi:hypothetical protein
MMARRFPPPWSIEELNDACYVVRDSNGQQLAYVYFEEEPGRRAPHLQWPRFVEEQTVSSEKTGPIVRDKANYKANSKAADCNEQCQPKHIRIVPHNFPLARSLIFGQTKTQYPQFEYQYEPWAPPPRRRGQPAPIRSMKQYDFRTSFCFDAPMPI